MARLARAVAPTADAEGRQLPPPDAAPRHFLDINQIDTGELRSILDSGFAYKNGRRRDRPMAGKMLAMIFEKPSTRTRVSFEVAARQLGGETIVIGTQDSQLGRGESVADTARVLSRYVDAIMMRTSHAQKLDDLAQYATVPVINGLTDSSHPCQIMADLMTLQEKKGPIAETVVAWSGDGNNVAASWVHAAVRFGFTLRLACPEELSPAPELLDWARREGRPRHADGRAVRGGRRGGLRRHRHVVVDGGRGQRQPPQPARPVPRRRAADDAGQARRDLHALPAGEARPGGHRRGHRRAAIGRLGRGGKPPARAKRHPRLVPALSRLDRSAASEISRNGRAF
jgi:hypothetical protein